VLGKSFALLQQDAEVTTPPKDKQDASFESRGVGIGVGSKVGIRVIMGVKSGDGVIPGEAAGENRLKVGETIIRVVGPGDSEAVCFCCRVPIKTINR
jgi:hypothetical protein